MSAPATSIADLQLTDAQLLELAEALEQMATWYQERPLESFRWLPGQHAFLHDPSPVKLARWGNQWGGKTTCGLAEVDWRCRGAHPFLDTRPPPIEAWIICASWSQSIAVQEKFWNLVDRAGLNDDVTFDPKNGFGSKNPTVKYKNGSVVRFKTTQQGGLNLSAATIDLVMFDEPPKSLRVYVEVSKRVMRRQGVVMLTLTPVNADCGWLRELCEAGQITDHHYRMEAKNMIPVSDTAPMSLPDGRPMDQAWIDEQLAATPAHERPVVCHGDWDMRVEGRIFTAFVEDRHVHARLPTEEVELCLGIDHGSRAMKQVAVLVAVVRSSADDWPRIYILDEEIDEGGERTPDGDAEVILGMLRRNGVAWHELDHVWGDRLYMKGPKDKKSNKDLQASIARKLKLPQARVRPKIQTVKRGAGHGAGSVNAGVRYLHHAQLRPGGFNIHPRCVRLIEAFNRWDFSDDELKDRLDALRYALDHHIFHTKRVVGRAPIVY